MGGSKRMMEEHQDELQKVTDRLQAAGAVTVCDAHEYTLRAGDPAAEEQVREDLAITLGEDEARALVSQALDQAFEVCPGCASAQRD